MKLCYRLEGLSQAFSKGILMRNANIVEKGFEKSCETNLKNFEKSLEKNFIWRKVIRWDIWQH